MLKFRALRILPILSILIHYNSGANPLIKRTRYGFVRGIMEQSKADPTIEYYSFMGIPYARPPVGELRFKEPLPPKPWKGIMNATKHAEKCVQFSDNSNGKEVIGSEDCLYLNVFVSKTARKSEQSLIPVMVWIHGGTFIFGSSLNAGPDYVMETEIIMVSIQYRLNVFGFLSTCDEAATGNFGLKDQNIALKWINENIMNFGGDPNRITIVGESAGGASVQYHILSSKSKGLFQTAISHSGSTMNRWAHQEYPRKMVLKLARGLGIRNVNSDELIKALQKIDYKEILKAAFNKWIVGLYTPYYAQPFGPTIESESETAFISESTYSLLEKGIYNPVTYILGYNTEEGSFAYDYVVNGRVDIGSYQDYPDFLVSAAFNITKGSMCWEEVLKQIKTFYFQNGPTNDKANWIKFMGQELFVRSIRKSVHLMYKHLPLYFYRFSFRGSRNESHLGGVGHHEELMYLWRSKRKVSHETQEDMLTRKRFVTMWTNFATTENPTPQSDTLLQNITWPMVTQEEEIPFLNIGEDLVVGKNPNEDDYMFWESLFDLCGNPPYTYY